MMYLKPSWAQGCGGLLHLAVLLSLAGLRMDLDLYLLLPPPPPLLRDPWTLLGSPGGAAYALPSFQEGAVGGWGQGHPKRPDTDSALSSEGQRLLQEVRTLGVPFIPRTHVDAWLVHCVASAGGADGPPRLLGNAAPTEASGDAGLGDPGGNSSGGGSGPAQGEDKDREAEEEKSPTAAPASGGVETSGCGVEEMRKMRPPGENRLAQSQPGGGFTSSAHDSSAGCLTHSPQPDPPTLQLPSHTSLIAALPGDLLGEASSISKGVGTGLIGLWSSISFLMPGVDEVSRVCLSKAPLPLRSYYTQVVQPSVTQQILEEQEEGFTI